jgi:hypothetical protein
LTWRPTDDDLRCGEDINIGDVAHVDVVAEIGAVDVRQRLLDFDGEDGIEANVGSRCLHEAATHPSDPGEEVDEASSRHARWSLRRFSVRVTRECMFGFLPYTSGVTWSARRLRSERLDVLPPNHESTAHSLSGELAGSNELPDAVLRDAEQLGCAARADQIAPLGHPARAR